MRPHYRLAFLYLAHYNPTLYSCRIQDILHYKHEHITPPAPSQVVGLWIQVWSREILVQITGHVAFLYTFYCRTVMVVLQCTELQLILNHCLIIKFYIRLSCILQKWIYRNTVLSGFYLENTSNKEFCIKKNSKMFSLQNWLSYLHNTTTLIQPLLYTNYTLR